MADEPNPEPNPDPKPADDDKLGDGGKKALDAERKARRDAEKKASDLEARLKELEDKDKSEGERLAARLAQAEKDKADAESRALRLEVAAAKGLTPTQARRLVGTTIEELEADADELLSSFKPSDGPPPNGAPARKPTENLRGGGDPTEEVPETDPAKLAALVPRDF